MMRARVMGIILLVLIISLAAVCPIVTGQQQPEIVPLSVMEAQISLADTTKWSNMNNGNMGMGPGMGSTQVKTGGDKQLIFTLKLKNDGAKNISTIHWESRFSDTKNRLIVKQFKTKKKIKSGKDETVEEPIEFDPKTLPDPLKIGYRIYKIEYADNTSWESAVTEAPETSYSYKFYKLQ
jgi:hypothetical protein